MAKPLTFDHLIGKKKPLTKRVPVVLDPELAEVYDNARKARDMANARAQVRPDDPESHAQLLEADRYLEEVAQQLEDEGAVVYFTFQGIGRARYEALVDRHPPTQDQRTKAKASGQGELAWNYDTFPPALVAACLVDPQLTAEQVEQLFDDENWNQAELAVLTNAAIEVNGTRRTVELGKGSRNSATRRGGPKSATA